MKTIFFVILLISLISLIGVSSNLFLAQHVGAMGAEGSPSYLTRSRINSEGGNLKIFLQKCDFFPTKKDFLSEIYKLEIVKVCDKEILGALHIFWDLNINNNQISSKKKSKWGDGWGNPILFYKTKRGFKLVSHGADGKPGGQGDNQDIEKEFEFKK